MLLLDSGRTAGRTPTWKMECLTDYYFSLPRNVHQISEAVFISKLTCQLSSFFVQNFVQTTSTLCKERRQLCTNNVNFARSTSTLQGQRQLCRDNVDFARTTTTLQGQRRLCKDNVDFARTTSTLQGQRQLCKDNVHFARTTSTLQGQRQLCHNNVNFVRTSCMTPWDVLSA